MTSPFNASASSILLPSRRRLLRSVGALGLSAVAGVGASQVLAAGKLRPIGVASPRRVPNFETIPTLQEQGLKGFEAYAWQGLVAPAGTPPEVITKLNTALLGALGSTAIKARLQTLGLESIPGTPRQMADYAAAERAKWGQVIQASGIKLD